MQLIRAMTVVVGTLLMVGYCRGSGCYAAAVGSDDEDGVVVGQSSWSQVAMRLRVSFCDLDVMWRFLHEFLGVLMLEARRRRYGR